MTLLLESATVHRWLSFFYRVTKGRRTFQQRFVNARTRLNQRIFQTVDPTPSSGTSIICPFGSGLLFDQDIK